MCVRVRGCWFDQHHIPGETWEGRQARLRLPPITVQMISGVRTASVPPGLVCGVLWSKVVLVDYDVARSRAKM